MCNVCSSLDKGTLQEWTDLEQLSKYGSVILTEHNIAYRFMLVIMSFILVGTYEYFTLDLP